MLKHLASASARRVERRRFGSETTGDASDIDAAAAGVAARGPATQLPRRLNSIDRRPNVDGRVHRNSQYATHVVQQSEAARLLRPRRERSKPVLKRVQTPSPKHFSLRASLMIVKEAEELEASRRAPRRRRARARFRKAPETVASSRDFRVCSQSPARLRTFRHQARGGSETPI
jgi:hypothetical protein